MMAFTATSLRIGDRGDNVRQLQARFNRDYPAYSKLVEDGDFGPNTEAVVREFERRSGLDDDGVAGPEVLTRLGLTLSDGEDKTCGDGLFVSPSTSCEFARNVRAEYFRVPGEEIEIEVFSPVTNKTYTMACIRTGDDVITCRGGNNAVVSFHA
jgi:peptidoglycan hydrolase-like protein with peptidoglycan-binding domain